MRMDSSSGKRTRRRPAIWSGESRFFSMYRTQARSRGFEAIFEGLGRRWLCQAMVWAWWGR